MVSQFKDNRFSTQLYNRQGETHYMLQKKISQAEFNKIHRIPELRKALNDPGKLPLLRNELLTITGRDGIPKFRYLDDLVPEKFSRIVADSTREFLNRADAMFSQASNSANDRKDSFYNLNKQGLDKLRDDYYNFKLEEIVTKYYERKKILFFNNSIVQNYDPIYLDPVKKGFPRFRTHFYAPGKYIFGMKADTFTFNICLVLFSTIILYIALYYEVLAKLVTFIEKFRLRKQFFRNLVM